MFPTLTSVRILLLMTAFWSIGARVYAAPVQSIDAINAVIRDFLQTTGAVDAKDAEIEIGQLDPRQQLQECPQPLEVRNASALTVSAHRLLNIRCTTAQVAWSIFLPATIRTRQTVAVLARPMLLHSPFTAADIRMELRDTAELGNSYFTDTAQLIGKTLELQLLPGLPIPQHAVRQIMAVKRGQTVTLMADADGMLVSMQGQALTDAAEGQRARVRNSSSKRIVEGTVTAPGIVSVDY